MNRNRAAFGLLICVFWLTGACRANALSDERLKNIKFEQRLDAALSLDTVFLDEQGKEVRLAKYFGQKPVVLVLGYYECPMLCSLVLNGMLQGMQEMQWSIGKEFEVINVSINPTEMPVLAAAKKHTYLKRYGRSGAANGWHFLTGDETAIRKLADEVGFQYAYDPESKQYAHPSGLVVLTPGGKVAKYLFGVSFSTKDLASALRDASSNRVGSRIQELILLCFHYRPITGKYGALIMTVVRILGAVTVLGLVWLIVGMARREKAKNEMSATAAGEATRSQPNDVANSRTPL